MCKRLRRSVVQLEFCVWSMEATSRLRLNTVTAAPPLMRSSGGATAKGAAACYRNRHACHVTCAALLSLRSRSRSRSISSIGVSSSIRRRILTARDSQARSALTDNGGHEQETSPGSQSSHSGDVYSLNLVAKRVRKFIKTNFLPIALVTGVAVGLVRPNLGCLAQKYPLAKFCTCGLFFISGMMLKTEEISRAMKAWPEGVFGLLSILLLTPLFSRLVLQITLTPQELVKGLAIFCCMPTTLSSGIALTQLVGGNSALAILLTVASNLLGIVTVPFMLSNLVAQGAGVSLPTRQLLKSLILTLLVPLLIGKGLRSIHKAVPAFVDEHRGYFSMLSSILLSMVPWMQVSGSRELLLLISPRMILYSMILGVGIHIVFLAWNAIMLWILSVTSAAKSSMFCEKANTRATILVASQKTLPVMIAIMAQLGNALGDAGLMIIPCVAAHINQIIVDSLIVNFWLKKDQLEFAAVKKA